VLNISGIASKRPVAIDVQPLELPFLLVMKRIIVYAD
jgi:hypothetical protein